MVQRRGYARTPLERSGQVNWSANKLASQDNAATINDGSPSCVIFVSKRKGWGTTGNHESRPMSIHGADYLNESFPPDKYLRYQVKVYLKGTGASTARQQTRGW